MMKLLIITIFLPTIVFTLESQMKSFYQTYYFSEKTETADKQITEELMALQSTNPEEQLLIKAFQTNILISMQNNSFIKMPPKNLYELKILYTELTDYCTKVGYDNLSSLFLTELANVRMRIMTYENIATLIKMSRRTKKDYEIAIKKDKNNFTAYLGLGQWYFYSPKIGGGSLKKAERTFNDGEKIITEPYQQYLVHLWRSQIYFKNKQEKKYQEELKKANEIFPNGGFYEYVIERNKQGNTP